MKVNSYSSVTTLYRTLDDGPLTEFSIHRVRGRSREPHRADDERGGESSAGASWRGLRKNQPVSEPLPRTFRWIARLPKDVRPLQLLRDYPRIANTLASNWGDSVAFRASLYDLLVDRRGNRRGFPASVVAELLRLRSYFHGGRV